MTPDDAATILLVEDDVATRTFLADNLSADGYELLVADCVSDGLRLLERKFPDLAVIDLGLPDASGYELLRHVRRADGVVQPARPADAAHGPQRPLVGARPRARLRSRRGRLRLQAVLLSGAAQPRGGAAAPLQPAAARGCVRAGELELDPASRDVRLRGARVALSQKEFALLRALVADPTRVFTKEELLRSIWGYRARGLDAHAGLPRLPAAPEARRLRRPLRRERVGRRLPPRRRPDRGPARAGAAALGVIRSRRRAKFLCVEGGELRALRPLSGEGPVAAGRPLGGGRGS